MRMLMAALALAAVAVGCTDQATAPEQQRTPAIAADFTNNPDAGPWIARGEYGAWFAWQNADGVRAIHASFDLPLTPGCGPALDAYYPNSWQVINHKGDFTDFTTRWIERDQGAVWILIVDWTQPGTCRGHLLLAEGLGRLTYTDNDVFAPDGGRSNANAFHYRGEGQLTTPAGDKVHYHGVFGGVWKPDGTFTRVRPAVVELN